VPNTLSTHFRHTMATVPTPEMKGWFAEREDEKLWPGTL